MKKSINIYTYLEDNAKLFETLDKYYTYTKIESYENFLTFISHARYDGMYLFIVDVDKLKGKKFSHFKDELLNSKHLFVSAYGKEIEQKVRTKLHSLDIGAIIEECSLYHKEIVHHIIIQANLYMNTFDNRFIKALLEYNDLLDIERELNPFLSFIAYKYNLTALQTSNIHLVFLSLFIAFKKDKFSKMGQILHRTIESPDIDTLYQKFKTDQNIETKIVSALLKIFNINIDTFQSEIYQELQQISTIQPIFILSTRDINYVWEQLFFLKNDTIVIISNLLIYLLARVDYMIVTIDKQNTTVLIKLFEKKSQNLTSYIEEVVNLSDNLLLQNLSKEEVTLKFQQNSSNSKIIDRDLIETMHYTDDQKISAKKFLEEFEIDQFLLDDLNDLATEIQSKLYMQETLNKETLNSIVQTLDNYVRVLHNTIEFQDIAYSLESLSITFSSLQIETIEKETIKLLIIYIKGLIDDLNSWKNHIFIEQNTPDIHYIDASLLENCTTIENLLLSPSQIQENDNEDLEFF